MVFNIQPLFTTVILVFAQTVSLKVVNISKIYQYSKYHGPTPTGASFAYSSEVLTSVVLEWLEVPSEP
jgi:hypothetical protein